VAVLVPLLCFAAAAPAQTLYTVDATTGVVDEITGPPGAFGYPNGPLVSSFVMNPAYPCPVPGPFTPAARGGIANDPILDHVFVTDGSVVAEYSMPGYPVNGWLSTAPIGGPITGLAFDPASGVLYVAGSALIAGIAPSAPGSCAPGAVVEPPWMPGVGQPISGLTWDPVTASLWAIDVAGDVWSIPVGGAATFAWSAIPDPVCGMLGAAGPPTSISYDATTPNAATPLPAFFISDGAVIVHTQLGGAPAASSFAMTTPCLTPVAGTGMLGGVVSTGHGVRFGTGSDPAGLAPPEMLVVGQFVSGAAKGGSVSIYMVGADQTPSFAALFAAIGPPIGPAPGAPLTGLGGNTILLPLANPLLDPIGPLPVLGGGIGASAALPPGVPAGTQVFLQWFVLKGSGGYQASDGLAFTVGSS
jgi:hypothetical protein